MPGLRAQGRAGGPREAGWWVSENSVDAVTCEPAWRSNEKKKRRALLCDGPVDVPGPSEMRVDVGAVRPD